MENSVVGASQQSGFGHVTAGKLAKWPQRRRDREENSRQSVGMRQLVD